MTHIMRETDANSMYKPTEKKPRKRIRHSWVYSYYAGRLRYAKCSKCNCEKWWDKGFNTTIYVDRYGNTSMYLPSCVLPYTKL